MIERPPHRPTGAAERPPRIAICGESRSANLGDAAIAASLAYLVRRHLPDADISLYDLSDRADSAEDGGPAPPPAAARRRAEALAARLGFGPSVRWRRQLREVARTARAWATPWPPPEAAFDLAIVGGGQLLMDNDLWFPGRLWLFRHRMGPHARAFAVHACGVGDTWSRPGRWLCRRVLADARLVARSVRDPRSRERAERHLGCPPGTIAVVPDPALWAAEAYGVTRDVASTAIGVGIMAPPAALQGAEAADATWLTEAFLLRFWRESIARIAAAGHEVRIFTNGSPDDHAFAARVRAALADDLRARTTLEPRPRCGDELVRGIARYRGIVAQRLHALIIAHSLGVPAVGLVWDDKVRQFGAMAGRPERTLEAETATPETAIRTLAEAMADDAGDRRRDALRAAAADGVAALLRAAGLGGAS